MTRRKSKAATNRFDFFNFLLPSSSVREGKSDTINVSVVGNAFLYKTQLPWFYSNIGRGFPIPWFDNDPSIHHSEAIITKSLAPNHKC
jgi:hypothetical protein